MIFLKFSKSALLVLGISWGQQSHGVGMLLWFLFLSFGTLSDFLLPLPLLVRLTKCLREPRTWACGVVLGPCIWVLVPGRLPCMLIAPTSQRDISFMGTV